MARFKLKNHTGAAKRFRRTGTGKLVRRKAGMRHILTSKSAKRKTRLMRESLVSAVDSKAINRLLPY
ncbi:MAG: 50S ribosomal protein L35 [Nitrospirae bacterium]|jgi:large subunit ribosomal protein L35|nr:50S ribosomal protein L35 [Nitrospirota bacterium]